MEVVVEFALVKQLGMFSFFRLKLDGYLKVGLGVDALENLSEGALIELADDFVVLAYLLRDLRHAVDIIINSKFPSLHFHNFIVFESFLFAQTEPIWMIMMIYLKR